MGFIFLSSESGIKFCLSSKNIFRFGGEISFVMLFVARSILSSILIEMSEPIMAFENAFLALAGRDCITIVVSC